MSNYDKSAKALAEALQERQSQRVEAETEARNQRINSTFGRQFQSNNIGAFRQRINQMNESFDRGLDYMVAEIVRKACPATITESVTDEELIQQIHFVKDNLPDVFNENAMCYSGASAEIVVNTAIGSTQPTTPAKLAQGILSFETGKDFNNLSTRVQRTMAVNNIDVGTTWGDANPEQNLYTENDNFYSQIRNSFLAQVSGSVREAVLRRTKKEVDRIRDSRLFNEEVMTEGLSEFEAQRIRNQMQKDARKTNVMAELFSNVRVFNENAEADSESFLKESIFQATVLETYAVLGMMTLSEEDLCIKLRKTRNAYLKTE